MPGRVRGRIARSTTVRKDSGPPTTPGGTETTAAPRCRPRPSSCRTPMAFWPSRRRRDATPPRIPSSRTFEQGVVDRDRECSPGGSSRATIRSVRANPSASPDQRALLNNLCARLCCHTRSRPALVSIPHRSAAGLRDQTDNQPDESTEGRSGRARPEHGQETGQRARYGGAGKHRRITITRVVQLARVDALLDDPGVLRPVQAVLRPRLGRPSTPMEVYLRLMFLKFRYRLGYETLSAVRDFGRALVCWPGLVALAGSIEPCYRAHGRHRPVAPGTHAIPMSAKAVTPLVRIRTVGRHWDHIGDVWRRDLALSSSDYRLFHRRSESNRNFTSIRHSERRIVTNW